MLKTKERLVELRKDMQAQLSRLAKRNSLLKEDLHDISE